MKEFLDYVISSYLGATGWNRDNSYTELNATATELLDFRLPQGLGITLSSLATPHFATSYRLGALGVVDGSLAYLYSSVPLVGVVTRSDQLRLPDLLRSYRSLNDLGLQKRTLSDPLGRRESSDAATTKGRGLFQFLDGGHLLYGRLYLPQSTLEASVVKRLSQTLQVQVSAVSAEYLRNGGTVLGLLQYDEGRFGVEGLASTDGGLLGLRGLYNFGGDASGISTPSSAPFTPFVVDAAAGSSHNGFAADRERIYGRFSVGGELYYGTLNKSGGMSLGARFATLPDHRGTPLTATLTLNPLMGSISATYAVQARNHCSLATSMDFNIYSYESDWKIGIELWSKRRPGGFLLGAQPDITTEAGPKKSSRPLPPQPVSRSFQAKLEWRLDDQLSSDTLPSTSERDSIGDEYLGVLKARCDQQLRIGLLWEGRVKSLIFSFGSGIDLRRLEQPFRTVGVDVQFSS
ncbi:hypothetical protein VTK73DRAFT_5156 [Phialemonium thermophilum]|uniref:Mitochondrial distribution and morphology protein 10 n=1 Tax=Phialemonium thermophilum TaxID=223376 RepID=A0ABR3XXN0_9PEZI